MKPGAIAVDVDFGTDDPSIDHPPEYPRYTPHRDDELPLHYMSQENTRRRAVRSAHEEPLLDEKQPPEYDDDDGKDVYNKIPPAAARISSGRPPQPPPPPPTSIVCIYPNYTGFSLTGFSDRVPQTKRRTPGTHHLHPVVVLDAVPQDWSLERRRLG